MGVSDRVKRRRRKGMEGGGGSHYEEIDHEPGETASNKGHMAGM